MGLRRYALAAAIAMTLASAESAWRAFRGPYSAPWYPVAMAAVVAFSLLLPVFYLALAFDRGALRMTRPLRVGCALAAVVLAALNAPRVPQWFGVIQAGPSGSVLGPDRSAWLLNAAHAAANLLGMMSILPLVALARLPEPDAAAAPLPAGRVLRTTARAVVVIWAVWLTFLLIRLVGAPLIALLLWHVEETYRAHLTVRAVADEAMRALVPETCLFMAPLAVWRGIQEADDGATMTVQGDV